MADLSYRLPELPHLRLRVTLLAHEPVRLPCYKGSMLRGAYGHALRKAVCAMGPQQPCATCALRRECAHTRLFETLIEPGDEETPPFLKGLPTGPRPYVFEPALEEMGRRDYDAGAPLCFDLLLFGRAVDLQAHALLALERMAQAGLGSRRRRFELERVEHPDGAGGWATGYQARRPGDEPAQDGRERQAFGIAPARVPSTARAAEASVA